MSEPRQLWQDSGPHLREAASPDETEEATWRSGTSPVAGFAFSVIGRLQMGWLADRFSTKQTMLLTYLLVASGIPFCSWGKPISLFMGQRQGSSSDSEVTT